MTKVAAMLTILTALLVPALAGAEKTTFVFERFNSTYTDLGGGPNEVKSGPITVRSTSSSNRFNLIGNRLELTPRPGGEHDALFWVHFEGEAEVEAEVLMAGFSAGQLKDEVTVLNQERTIRARIKIARQGEDYLLTVVEAPKDMTIQVHSRLGTQIVSMCESLTRFAFGASCDGLDAAMSNPKVPVAEPGDEFVLQSALMTAEEKAQLEAYLGPAQ
jgi:hypothetical protein